MAVASDADFAAILIRAIALEFAISDDAGMNLRRYRTVADYQPAIAVGADTAILDQVVTVACSDAYSGIIFREFVVADSYMVRPDTEEETGPFITVGTAPFKNH